MITYTKLKDGTWGVRVSGETVAAGQTITVNKKDGTTKQETIKTIVWSGDGVQLCSVGHAHKSTATRGNTCAECGRGGKLVCDLEDGLMKHYNCCDIPP